MSTFEHTADGITLQAVRDDRGYEREHHSIQEMEEKERALFSLLATQESAVVAYSGGVDSTYVLWAASQVLGERVLAVIGKSESLAGSELDGAVDEAQRMGVSLQVLDTKELDDPRFRDNPTNRCYHCKSELFGKLASLAREQGLAAVLDGTNADDLADFRPGRRAAAEQSVRSPLAEVGLTKGEIRTLSKRAGITTWDKPAMPCLASRFPYGTRITSEKLSQVEKAELWLRSHGFPICRVRHHGEKARIEVPSDQIGRLLKEPLRTETARALTRVGFKFVSVDMGGFRSGNLNQDVNQRTARRVVEESLNR